VAERVTPYDHQEEAILQLFEGKNVILNTPTGSGKSLVALALQFRAFCLGRRAWYTVPVKALANEKFLALCRLFGAEHVGMITGDASVNSRAPVVCCTAEILANVALRQGGSAPVDDVIMDEFHYYADPARGSAWQIPLLTLPRSRFLLMSATLGDTSFFESALTELNGASTVLVHSADRPVPLEFTYNEELLLEEQVADLVSRDRAPVYLVHFTQAACAATAQNLLSRNFSSKEEKQRLADALQGQAFRTPYGKEIQKLLRHGIGIHHAGLLPKYRVLVEQLAQRGLLKVICGTDTLGVGINVPIRTVLLTQLCKYDGTATRILSARDFHQICGRAGRRGFDTLGHVVAQAPEHIIENARLERKAQASPGKKKNFVKRKPPEKGFVGWDANTFRRLIAAPPERLVSRFRVTHALLLQMLSRPDEDGSRAVRDLLRRCHESPSRRKQLRREAFRCFRGLVRAGILTVIPPAERSGPARVRLHVDLQEDFTLHHALGLWLLDTLPLLDQADPDYPLQVISLAEAILENPDAILRKQVDRLKSELMAELKAEGADFEERILRLEEVEWPKPGQDFIYGTFNRFCETHPWVDKETIRPKSVARELVESWASFEDYVKRYGLERSEGVLLRHLSDVHRVLEQTVPPAAKTPELEDAIAFLESAVRGVDSSLLDEWRRLLDPETTPPDSGAATPPPPTRPIALTRDPAAFTRLVRAAVFALLQSLERRDWDTVLDLLDDPGNAAGVPWTPRSLEEALRPFRESRGFLRFDPAARSLVHTRIRTADPDSADAGCWRLEQTLVDPEEENDWMAVFRIDLRRSDEERRVCLRLESVGPIS
jgi:hypothetical protein